MERVDSAQEVAQYLAFTLGATTYGFPVECVREVVKYTTVFKIPRVPEHIHGVVNIRGDVLPVIDLSYVFYGKKASLSGSSSIMFIEARYCGETVVAGLLIDSVEAVTDIVTDSIEESPPFGYHVKSEFVTGIGKVGNGFIIILDIDHVLDIQMLSRFGAYGTTT
jgi:chemotaxis signal transduction protein